MGIKERTELSMGYSRDTIRENLRAAGCEETQMQEFLLAFDEGNMKKALAVLDVKREELLEEYHACGKCIDCMDYFVHQLKREG